jgi:hypothetical protein
MHHMKTTTSPPKQSIRLTIPVTPEVHEAFTRISKASGMPVGRAMGEWLGDTLDAAQFLADTLEKARSAPRLVAQQLHAYAQGMADETGTILAQHAQRAGGDGVVLAPIPPLCNTGGKVPPRKGKPS